MSGRHAVTISDEAWSMIERAKQKLNTDGSVTGRTFNRREALDWLLRDLCEYGSPVVGAWARDTWPDAAETKSWRRRQQADRYSALSAAASAASNRPHGPERTV